MLILTIIGANLGAKALTQPVANWATPKIEEKIAVKVEKTLEDRTQEQGRTLEELLPDSLRNLLNRTGLMENLRGALERQAESTIAGHSQSHCGRLWPENWWRASPMPFVCAAVSGAGGGAARRFSGDQYAAAAAASFQCEHAGRRTAGSAGGHDRGVAADLA